MLVRERYLQLVPHTVTWRHHDGDSYVVKETTQEPCCVSTWRRRSTCQSNSRTYNWNQ